RGGTRTRRAHERPRSSTRVRPPRGAASTRARTSGAGERRRRARPRRGTHGSLARGWRTGAPAPRPSRARTPRRSGCWPRACCCRAPKGASARGASASRRRPPRAPGRRACRSARGSSAASRSARVASPNAAGSRAVGQWARKGKRSASAFSVALGAEGKDLEVGGLVVAERDIPFPRLLAARNVGVRLKSVHSAERAGFTHPVAGQRGKPQARALVPRDHPAPGRWCDGGPNPLVRKLTVPERAALAIHERHDRPGLLVVPGHETALFEAREAGLRVLARAAAHRFDGADERLVLTPSAALLREPRREPRVVER